ncbi:hypothetical protein AV955_gp069 [Diadromus pulchellus ascovirus 4a]|uniref:Complete DpAV4 genome n=1 Tax=Diadromus pulchellus ascovirus 4a TaxID=158683 RepID=F2NYZ8_9VIRU|nr:hypothetical protein AV955_gp069 [Diadromus pulchellus ascovirus 4a]CCA61426.1 unnamed protein product [Diadromus pulchellus ascovirus 4a]
MSLNYFDKVYKKEWLLGVPDHVVITKDVLSLFGITDLEPELVAKLERLSVPVEKVSSSSDKLTKYNDIQREALRHPNKKVWVIVKTSLLKKALFNIGGTRISTDLRRHYADMEDAVRKMIDGCVQNEDRKTLVETAVERAFERYTHIIDQKIIDKLTN